MWILMHSCHFIFVIPAFMFVWGGVPDCGWMLLPILLLLFLLRGFCTYRLQQRRAASVHVAGRVGAGGSDCAAASRTGCPNGLAVGDETHARTHRRDSNTPTETTEDTMATRQNRETRKKNERGGDQFHKTPQSRGDKMKGGMRMAVRQQKKPQREE